MSNEIAAWAVWACAAISLLAMGVGLATAVSLVMSAYRVARLLVAAMVSLIVVVWGVAQLPSLVVPELTLASSASPAIPQELTFYAVLICCAPLAQSLYLLFKLDASQEAGIR